MKKILALILCILMIVTAALPVFAEDNEPAAQSAQTSGSLVITEVLMVSSEEGYSYIEIFNNSDNTVDLSDYYLIRIGSNVNAAKAYLSVTNQMLGLGTTKIYKGIVAIKLNGEVAPHGTVVVMMNDKFTKNQFIDYWNNNGADFDKTDANADEVYDEPRVIDFDFSGETNLTPKPMQEDYAYSTTHKNFLPRNTRAMCSLALVQADNVSFDGGTWYNDNTAWYRLDGISAKSYLQAADCTVLLNFMGHVGSSHANLPAGKSVNFSSFVDNESTYNTAVAATDWPDNLTDTTKHTTCDYADLAAINLEVSDGTFEGLADCSTAYKWNDTATKALAMPKVRLDSTPTPCKLVEGQFGYVSPESNVNTEGVQDYTNEATDTADIRFVASLKGDYRTCSGAGFEFTYGGNTKEVECNYVYETLNSKEGTISPDDYEADYFFCYTLRNISEGNYTIAIRSWLLENGSTEKTYSEEKTVTFTVASDGSVTFN